MRYMGDVVSDLASGPLDPTAKAILIAQAPSIPEDRARDIVDVADATAYGKRMKLIHYGAGAAAGLVVGLVLSRLKKGRR